MASHCVKYIFCKIWKCKYSNNVRFLYLHILLSPECPQSLSRGSHWPCPLRRESVSETWRPPGTGHPARPQTDSRKAGSLSTEILHNLLDCKESIEFLTHVSPFVFPPQFLAPVPGIVGNRVVWETVDEEAVILSEVERFHVEAVPGDIKIFLE